MSNIIVQVANAAGVVLSPQLQWDRVEYSLIESDIGTLVVEGPLSALPAGIGPDAQLRVLRSVYGTTPYLEGGAVWLLRQWTIAITLGGERRYRIEAQHVNSLLARRIVDYAAGSAQTSKTGAADDLIKEVVAENFVSPTDVTRTMSGLGVDPDLAAAPSVSKAFAYQQTLSVIKALCAQSAQNGTYLGFEVVPTAGGDFQVITFTSQRGIDRTARPSAAFSLERRNLASGSLTYDYTEEATRVIAGGQGEKAARDVERADNADAQSASPYGLIEAFRQANGVEKGDTAALQGEAEAGLWQKRGRVRFAGSAQQITGSLYGVDYGWGDIVPVQFEGITLACRIPVVRNTATKQNGEDLDIRLSSDSVL